MPDNENLMNDAELDQLLAYREQPADDAFVINVMQDVRREQRRRRMILVSSGVIGAGFGLLGASLLSDSISTALTTAFTGDLAHLSAGASVAILAGITWLLQDDASSIN